MPQLFSRMDDTNWLTPSIADILDQGAAPQGGDGSMREIIVQLQEEFAALETPVKVVNVRPTPSYTLFVLQPETVGRLGSRRTTTIPELRRSVGQIAERNKEWRLGFMGQLEDAPEAVGLLMRTDQHRPLSLRRLLIRSTFRDHPSSLAFTLGNTLDQRLIVRDLEQIPHLLIVGEGSARQHLVSSLLLTLALLNTPGEIRLLLAGKGGEAYGELVKAPHMLAAHITDADELLETLTGLMSEAQSRLERFYEEGVNQLESYNTRMRDQGKAGMPRIVATFDPLTDEAFQPQMNQLAPMVRDLLVNGAQVGIHLIVTVDQALPEALDGLFPLKVVMRSTAPELGEKVKNWHGSLQRFIDAFIVENNDAEVTPVELCAILPGEIRATVDYWQGVVTQRGQEAQPDGNSTTSGITAVLNPPQETAPQLQHQAGMLAAYLGWLSVGALRDILALSDQDARHVLQQLQTAGIIETGDSPMLRFIRLAERG